MPHRPPPSPAFDFSPRSPRQSWPVLARRRWKPAGIGSFCARGATDNSTIAITSINIINTGQQKQLRKSHVLLILEGLHELARLEPLQQTRTKTTYLGSAQRPHCFCLAREDVPLRHLKLHTTVTPEVFLEFRAKHWRLPQWGYLVRLLFRVLFLESLLFWLSLLFFLEVGVAEGLFRCDPFLGIDFEHLPEQIHDQLVRLLVFLCREVEAAGPVLVENLVVGFALEETLAEDKQVEDEAETEDIANWRILRLHILYVYHLRGHVAGSAAPHEEILLRIGELGEAVIGNHALVTVSSSKQDVLGFEVPVHDILRVHLFEALKYAPHHLLHVASLELLLRLHQHIITLIFSKSCPPSSSSKMMYSELSDSNTSQSFMLWGLLRLRMISISLSRHSLPFSSLYAASFEKAFTAYFLPSSNFSARQTEAKLPFPIFLMGLNCSWKPNWLRYLRRMLRQVAPSPFCSQKVSYWSWRWKVMPRSPTMNRSSKLNAMYFWRYLMHPSQIYTPSICLSPAPFQEDSQRRTPVVLGDKVVKKSSSIVLISSKIIIGQSANQQMHQYLRKSLPFLSPRQTPLRFPFLALQKKWVCGSRGRQYNTGFFKVALGYMLQELGHAMIY